MGPGSALRFAALVRDDTVDQVSGISTHLRHMHLLPKRGDKPEWQHSQDYWVEKDEIPAVDLDDGAFVYN